MNTRNRLETIERMLERDAARRATLGEALQELLGTVWQCERFERQHPYTCATVRSLAPRVKRDA